MLGTAGIIALIKSYGLLILAPVAVLEGPIVTVIGAYLAKLGFMNLYAVFAVVIVADLIGDMMFYELGRNGARFLSPKWQHRLHLDDSRLADLADHFETKGGRTLVFGKITHSAGMLVLAAAGAAKMKVPAFLFWNLVATVPKCLFFMVIGYTLGYAYADIDGYIFQVSIVLLIVVLLIGLGWFLRRKFRA